MKCLLFAYGCLLLWTALPAAAAPSTFTIEHSSDGTPYILCDVTPADRAKVAASIGATIFRNENGKPAYSGGLYLKGDPGTLVLDASDTVARLDPNPEHSFLLTDKGYQKVGLPMDFHEITLAKPNGDRVQFNLMMINRAQYFEVESRADLSPICALSWQDIIRNCSALQCITR
jgi:hypothetical protein